MKKILICLIIGMFITAVVVSAGLEDIVNKDTAKTAAAVVAPSALQQLLKFLAPIGTSFLAFFAGIPVLGWVALGVGILLLSGSISNVPSSSPDMPIYSAVESNVQPNQSLGGLSQFTLVQCWLILVIIYAIRVNK